ncbi:PASTA domain-containing protein, partial [Alistipes onderdonkii]|nr:PASTA domain-containing protein [Alistipes onderdonkii]
IVVGVIAALAIVGLAAFALMGGFASGAPLPNVTGKTVEEATAILKEAGFELGTTDQKYDDKVPAGQIVGQDPKAGDKREKGSKVNVTVSQGVAQITVPDVKGLDAEK